MTCLYLEEAVRGAGADALVRKTANDQDELVERMRRLMAA